MSALATGGESTDERKVKLTIIFGKSKFVILSDIHGLGITAKLEIQKVRYPKLKCKFMKLLVKGKEWGDEQPLVEVVKIKESSSLKVKLMFDAAYHTELNDAERRAALVPLAESGAHPGVDSDIYAACQEDQVFMDSEPTPNIVYDIGVGEDLSKCVAVTVVHSKEKYHFRIGMNTTLGRLKKELERVTDVGMQRFVLIAKGKKLEDPKMLITSVSGATKSNVGGGIKGGKVMMRLLFDEKYHAQAAGKQVLDEVIASLAKTEKEVHSMYAKIAHNFYDHAVMTLTGSSFDEELEALERNLIVIKISASEEAKRESAMKRLQKIKRENDRINDILAEKMGF